MHDDRGTYAHFTTIASEYGQVRTTDEEPILYMSDQLQGLSTIEAADVGCGDGRYDLLLYRILPRLKLTCVDINSAMLKQLTRHFDTCGVRNYQTLVSSMEDLDLAESSFDCVFTFNAIHHLGLETFLKRAGSAIRPGGHIFIYTRTPDQNERTIWGRYLPGFAAKESRLYSRDEMMRCIEQVPELRVADVRTFKYRREVSLDRLRTQARSRHYSTLSLYQPDELEAALDEFASKIRCEYSDLSQVAWHDENTLLHIQRSA